MIKKARTEKEEEQDVEIKRKNKKKESWSLQDEVRVENLLTGGLKVLEIIILKTLTAETPNKKHSFVEQNSHIILRKLLRSIVNRSSTNLLLKNNIKRKNWTRIRQHHNPKNQTHMWRGRSYNKDCKTWLPSEHAHDIQAKTLSISWTKHVPA